MASPPPEWTDRSTPPALAPNSSASQRDALDRLWVIVHEELRRAAHFRLAQEREGHTLSTTALVHEVYLKLAAQRTVSWDDRAQFLALSAQAMRRILVDYARRHRRMRDGVRYDSADADDPDDARSAVRLAAAQRADELLALDEALEALTKTDDRLRRVVECRFFAGYTEAETAEILGVTPRTVSRDWVKAKEILYRALQDRTNR